MDYDKLFTKLIKKLARDSKLYGWMCGTKRNFKVDKNKNHLKKPHFHSILLSNLDISELDLLIEFKKIFKNDKLINCFQLKKIQFSDQVDIVLKYIHDGHHILKMKIYKFRYKKIKLFINPITINNSCINTKQSLRSVFKNMRVCRI